MGLERLWRERGIDGFAASVVVVVVAVYGPRNGSIFVACMAAKAWRRDALD